MLLSPLSKLRSSETEVPNEGSDASYSPHKASSSPLMSNISSLTGNDHELNSEDDRLEEIESTSSELDEAFFEQSFDDTISVANTDHTSASVTERRSQRQQRLRLRKVRAIP